MATRLNFTKWDIDALALPPQGKRLWVYDSKVRGLALQVTSTGAKSFYVVRKVEGRTEFIRLSAYPDLTIEQARKRAQEINGEIARGINPAHERREKRREWTLGELWAGLLGTPRQGTQAELAGRRRPIQAVLAAVGEAAAV
jgi:hypothetical protein